MGGQRFIGVEQDAAGLPVPQEHKGACRFARAARHALGAEETGLLGKELGGQRLVRLHERYKFSRGNLFGDLPFVADHALKEHRADRPGPHELVAVPVELAFRRFFKNDGVAEGTDAPLVNKEADADKCGKQNKLADAAPGRGQGCAEIDDLPHKDSEQQEYDHKQEIRKGSAFFALQMLLIHGNTSFGLI